MTEYTPNYSLEKTEDGDDWSSGYRSNLNKIDIGMQGAQDDADDAQARLVPVESATALIPSIQTTLAGVLSTVATAPEAYQYSGTFNSTTGTAVALPKEVSSVTDYIAYAIPTGDATNVGSIWIEKAVTQFVVKCTGADTTTGFVAIVFYVGSHDVFGSNSFRRYYASPSASITDHGDDTATGGIAAVAKGITDAIQKAALELPANGTYQFRQDYTLSADVELLPQPGVLVQPYMSIRSATYKWTSAVCGTDTYYLEIAAGGDPGVEEPYGVYQDGTALTEGTDCGSLAAGEWFYGDDPTASYSTIYVRLSTGADPDTLAADTLNAGYEVLINSLSPATGMYRWIDVTLGGLVKFGSNCPPIRFAWFGTNTAAQQAAIDSSYYSSQKEVVVDPTAWTTTGLKIYGGQTLTFVKGASFTMSGATSHVIRTTTTPADTTPTTSVRKVKIIDPVIDMNDTGYCGLFLEGCWEADIRNPVITNVPGGTFSYNDGNGAATFNKSGIVLKSLDGTYDVGCYYNHIFKPIIEGIVTSIRTATYKWTLSGSGTDTYYLEIAAGGDPGVAEPNNIWQSYSALTLGSGAATLSEGEWYYDADPGATFNTVYVRLSGGVDPDTLTAGDLLATRGETGILITSSTGASSFRTNDNTIYMPKVYYCSKGVFVDFGNDNIIDTPSQIAYAGTGIDDDGYRTRINKPYLEVCTIGIDSDNARYSEIYGMGAVSSVGTAWQNTGTYADYNTWWGSGCGPVLQPYAPATMAMGTGGMIKNIVDILSSSNTALSLQTQEDSGTTYRDRIQILDGAVAGSEHYCIVDLAAAGASHPSLLRLAIPSSTLSGINTKFAAAATFRGLIARYGSAAGDGVAACLLSSNGSTYQWVTLAPVTVAAGAAPAAVGNGHIHIDTSGNTAKIYADGDWRTIASGW